MGIRRKYSLWLLVFFYVIAGLNHFIHPNFYAGLIPDYLPFHEAINVFSGLMEIVLGLGLIWSRTRKLSAQLIILMLLLFIPSHVYFIRIGSCVSDGLCTPEWVGWVRLVVIHPVLILWAWLHRN
jgi:uncharacterized membrane protein